MMAIATALFALAAIIGVAMAALHFRGQTPPRPILAALHGLFAAAGLVLLMLAVLLTGAGTAAGVALGLFLLAALGGFALLALHLRGRALPNGLILGHGLLAVVAFVILLVAGLVLGI